MKTVVVICFIVFSVVFVPTVSALEGFVGLPQAVKIRARTVVNVSLKKGNRFVPLSSGVIVDNQGYVLTVATGLDKDSDLQITLWDETRFGAKLVGKDPETNLAVLKLASDGPFPIVTIKRSGDLPLGSEIFIIADPYAEGHMVSRGIVSYRMLVPSKWINFEVFLSDADYMRALRGGPVFDENVEMVGLVTDLFEGVGLSKLAFISWQEIQKILPMLKQGRVIKRGWLGISARTLSAEETAKLGLPFNYGVKIVDVKVGSPAERAGLQKGDVVLQIGQTPIRDLRDMKEVIEGIPVGVGVIIKFFREGKVLMAEIVPEPASTFIKSPETIVEDALGIEVIELTPEMSGLIGLGPIHAVFIKKVIPGSIAENFNLRKGDIILKVNSRPIEGLVQLAELLQRLTEGHSVVFKVKRRTGYAYITIGL